MEELVATAADLKDDNQTLFIRVEDRGCRKRTKQMKQMDENRARFCNQISRLHMQQKDDPKPHDKFVFVIFQTIIQHLLVTKKYKTIVVIGYGYGGMIVSRIAELFQNGDMFLDLMEREFMERSIMLDVDEFNETYKQYMTALAQSVMFYTCGSIYVPGPAKVDAINIEHFMIENDASLETNGLVDKETSPHVTWLADPSPRPAPVLLGPHDYLKPKIAYDATVGNLVRKMSRRNLYGDQIEVDIVRAKSVALPLVKRSNALTPVMQNAITNFAL